MNSFEIFISTLIKKHNVTQKTLAIAMGYTDSYLSHIKKLRKPIPSDFIQRLKNVIELSGNELMELSNIIQNLYKNPNESEQVRFKLLLRDLSTSFQELIAKLSMSISTGIDKAKEKIEPILNKVVEMLQYIKELFINANEKTGSLV